MKQNIILAVPLFDMHISFVSKNKLVCCKFTKFNFKNFCI